MLSKQPAPSENRALKIALNFIKFRPRSSLEVVKRLQRWRPPAVARPPANFSSDVINSVVEQLTKLDILNDRRFATDWVRARDRLAPRGKFLLRRELREKGITDELVEEVLTRRETKEWREEIGLPAKGAVKNRGGHSFDYYLAADLLARRQVKWNKLAPLKQKKRAADLLARRGFSGQVIYDLLNLL